MKIKTVVEVLRLLSDAAYKQASEIQDRAKQPHEMEAGENWEKIGRAIDRTVGEIEVLPTRKGDQ